MAIFFLFLLTLFNFSVPSSTRGLLQAQDQGVRAAYWNSLSGFPASSIDTRYFSHIFYAFVLPSPATYALNVGAQDADRLREFSSASRSWNPRAKTLLSIGGGGGDSLVGIFSQMASRQSSRATFINSTIKVARQYGLDGVDLDWEYPRNQTDMSNLGLLFKEWRQALENEASITRRARLLLTAAVWYASDVTYYGPPQTPTYPIQAITQYVDWINAMCYDYHGSWQKSTGLHSALDDPNSNLNTKFGIGSWIQKGVPPRKIVMGLPLYGRTWTLESPNNNVVGAPTIGVGPGDDGTLTYSKVTEFNRENNARVVFDQTRVSYYSYAGNSWVSYDDVESVKPKIQYARTQSLGGYFFWALGQDLDWTISRTASQAWLA